jgi:hypothetical protein
MPRTPVVTVRTSDRTMNNVHLAVIVAVAAVAAPLFGLVLSACGLVFYRGLAAPALVAVAAFLTVFYAAWIIVVYAT